MSAPDNSWARRYIGKAWAADGVGPDRFSCWGLVRFVFTRQFGIEMPAIAVVNADGDVDPENVRRIKFAAGLGGWRPVRELGARPKDRDIVLMRSVARLHVGVVLAFGGEGLTGVSSRRVLHCHHQAGVVCEPWADAIRGMTPELWRRK